jgi:hypothetical protein
VGVVGFQNASLRSLFLQIKLDKNTLTCYIYSGYVVVFNVKGASDV